MNIGYLLAKVAAKAIKDLTEEEAQRVLEERKQKRQMTAPTQKLVYEMAGRPFTPGQYGRYTAAGALSNITGHLLGGAIEGEHFKVWKPNTLKPNSELGLLHPRKLGRAALMGAIFGAAVPAARKLWDINAAQQGYF